MKRTHREGAFTLLELLMVVVIIAILASIALPQYLKAAERARLTEALSTLGAIRTSQQRFRAQNPAGQYSGGPITGVLPSPLDIDIPGSGGVPISLIWGSATTTIAGVIGGAQVIRLVPGPYAGQIVGMTYGTGTVCGNYNVVPGIVACGAGD